MTNNRVINLDMFVDCKKPTTAIKTFVKELKAKYTVEQIGGFDEELIEVVGNKCYNMSEKGGYNFEMDFGIEDRVYVSFITFQNHYM